jgi:hypothetical protein
MRFQVRAGSRAGTTFEVDRNGVTIGRGADCNLVIDDNKASRRHARIQQLPDGRIAVQDLGSSNGTLVNGSPIQSVVLDGAATIQIGNTVIDAVPAAAPAAPVAAAAQSPFAAPTPQQVGPSGERLSRVQRLTPSVVQRMTPSTIQRVIKRRSRRGMIIVGSVAGVVIAGLVVALIVFSGGDEIKPAPDKGDFQVQVMNASGDQANFQKVVIESGVVNEVVKRLNTEIALPKNVPVILRPSEGDGDISPFWNPKLDRIEFPYLWVAVVAKLFSENEPNLTRDELVERVTDTTYFVLYHEIGHGLVDLLHLPVTGKEEDAVDGLAAAILIPSGDTAVRQVLRSAELFQLLGASREKNAEAFADEHSLGEQRFYQLSCWIYGSNPVKYSYVVENGYLPDSRAARCEDEYKQNVTSWQELLKRYMKPRPKSPQTQPAS